MYDGFHSYEGNAVRWVVCHDHGETSVYAPTESLAYQRFMDRYPNRKVTRIYHG